jgi:hypothetical protein
MNSSNPYREGSRGLRATAPTTFLATRREQLTLALTCRVAFLDFVDASIVNVVRPSIRRALHFSK